MTTIFVITYWSPGSESESAVMVKASRDLPFRSTAPGLIACRLHEPGPRRHRRAHRAPGLQRRDADLAVAVMAEAGPPASRAGRFTLMHAAPGHRLARGAWWWSGAAGWCGIAWCGGG